MRRVNSKATLRVSLKDLLPLVPPLLHQLILESRYHAQKSGTLVIQADSSRKQKDNADDCTTKLIDFFRDESRNVVKGVTSHEKAKRVMKMYDMICLDGYLHSPRNANKRVGKRPIMKPDLELRKLRVARRVLEREADPIIEVILSAFQKAQANQ